MFSSLDQIDLLVPTGDDRVAVQTDHRSAAEIVSAPELSVLFAMARVLNARQHLEDDTATVRYTLPGEAPEVLLEALRAVGATIEQAGRPAEAFPAAADGAAGELADRTFAALARRAATRLGTADLAIALRLLEGQTRAAPPDRETDELGYWQAVLELTALTGELLRAKHGGLWVATDKSIVPFAFQITSPNGETATQLLPANRAQRLLEEDGGESMFQLLVAVEETLARDGAAPEGRLMPSLRNRGHVALDEVLWRPLVEHAESEILPVVVYGIDGETTFAMLQRATATEPHASLIGRAIENLDDEQVDTSTLELEGVEIVAVTESFYAAEKLLDRAFMKRLHGTLGTDTLLASTPCRGLLLVTRATTDREHLAVFAALTAMRHDEAHSQAISPTILIVADGEISGYLQQQV